MPRDTARGWRSSDRRGVRALPAPLEHLRDHLLLEGCWNTHRLSAEFNPFKFDYTADKSVSVSPAFSNPPHLPITRTRFGARALGRSILVAALTEPIISFANNRDLPFAGRGLCSVHGREIQPLRKEDRNVL